MQAAGAMRRLNDLLVAHDGGDELLLEIASALDSWSDRLRSTPLHSFTPSDMRADTGAGPPADGEVIEHHDRCPVSGAAHPGSYGLTARRVGDEVHCHTVLGPACEGPPGRAHGGIVAALFDDATAFLTKLLAEPCFAAQLTVNYRQGVPLGVPITIRAWVARRDGRKIYTEAVAEHDGERIADATCLKLAIS